MSEPTHKDIATLFVAALIFAIHDEVKPAAALAEAKLFMDEAAKELPAVFNDA